RVMEITKSIGIGFEPLKGVYICFFLGGIRASRGERNFYLMAGIFGCFFDSSSSAQYNQVGYRNLLVSRLRFVKRFLDALECFQYIGQLFRIMSFPIFLWCQAYASAVGTAAFVRIAISCRR